MIWLTYVTVQAEDNASSRWEGLNQQVVDAYKKGLYREAIPLAEQASDLARQAFGEQHPNTLSSMLNSTVNHANLGQIPKALRELRRMEPALLAWIGAELYSTESAAVRSGLVASQSTYQHVALSLAVQAADHGAAQILAASTVLRFKGLIAEEEAYLARITRRGQAWLHSNRATRQHVH